MFPFFRKKNKDRAYWVKDSLVRENDGVVIALVDEDPCTGLWGYSKFDGKKASKWEFGYVTKEYAKRGAVSAIGVELIDAPKQ